MLWGKSWVVKRNNKRKCFIVIALRYACILLNVILRARRISLKRDKYSQKRS
jgi:hypothetical protein